MRLFSLVLLTAVAGLVFADPEVDRLLEADEAPAGVVFEIVEGEEDALRWALPEVTRLSARLRERFPDLPIAGGTQGREQFGLLANEAAGPVAASHGRAQQWRAEAIDLHVCGVHAGWDGYTPEDFPAYVDVSASGPAQISDYRNIGFVLIELERPDP
mgnify:CR=1 FL=1